MDLHGLVMGAVTWAQCLPVKKLRMSIPTDVRGAGGVLEPDPCAGIDLVIGRARSKDGVVLHIRQTRIALSCLQRLDPFFPLEFTKPWYKSYFENC